MAFPTLSAPPLVEPYEESAAQDPVIRSPKEAGYVQTRPRFTRVPKKWHLSYAGMSSSDRTSIKSWESTSVYGANSDTWTNPADSTQYTVRLAGPIRYKFSVSDSYWSFEFDLEEV